MPEARLQRTRETLPPDGSYQFGHGVWGVMQCSACGEYGHAWCGLAKPWTPLTHLYEFYERNDACQE